jgi:hydroxymethylpyrimidine pyrophosphatase-like HAD family hydrolase
MSRTVFACDLDRTLIYSRRARHLGPDNVPTTCVEIHDGKQASFMTSAAARALAELAATGLFVPVTTRTTEQYRRVLLPGRTPRFAVTTNGGVLLVDGRPDPTWTQQVTRVLSETVPVREIWEHAGFVCRPEFTDKLRNASGMFCYAVVHPSRLPSGFLADVSGWAAERGWRTSLQGRKLYWVPECLTKAAAVAEVAARGDCDRVLAAGDSLLDVDLLLGADLGVHPRHGELYEQGWCAPRVTVTAASGIVAGEQIVNWFSTGAGSPVRPVGAGEVG